MDLTNTQRELQSLRNTFVITNPNLGVTTDMRSYKHKYVVYLIFNVKTGRGYIGSTVDFNNRVNRYLNGVRFREEPLQPITRAMIDEGFENFRILPLCVVDDRNTLRKQEREYYKEFNTLHPNGYNRLPPPSVDVAHSARSGIVHQSAREKANRCKFIAAVDVDRKILIISEGMKLFADLTSSTKDLVKNEARDGRRHRGFYIIYLNTSDRVEMYDKINAKLIDVLNGVYRTPTKRSRHRAKYHLYVEASNLVSTMMDEGTADVFINAGYKCSYLHYDLSEEKDYLIDPISVFFETVDLNKF